MMGKFAAGKVAVFIKELLDLAKYLDLRKSSAGKYAQDRDSSCHKYSTVGDQPMAL